VLINLDKNIVIATEACILMSLHLTLKMLTKLFVIVHQSKLACFTRIFFLLRLFFKIFFKKNLLKNIFYLLKIIFNIDTSKYLKI
jgi:hypothetical protein